MFKIPENREFPRMAIDCGITYSLLDESDARHAVIKNISGGGVLFLAEEQPEVGAMMEIKVSPGNMSIPPLSAVVEVVRVNPGDGAAAPAWSVDGARPGAPQAGPAGPGACFEVGARIMSVK